MVPNVTIQGERVEEEYVITIADNGIGFDQKYSDKVFVIFQRLHGHAKYIGTGVGLSISKKIVEFPHCFGRWPDPEKQWRYPDRF